MQKKFEDFDFNGNEEFQKFLQNMESYPSNDKVMQVVQKRWYKKNIDPEYQQEETKQQEQKEEQKQEKQEQKQEKQGQQQQQSQPQQRQQAAVPMLYVIEGVLKIVYFPGLVLTFLQYGLYLNLLSLVICLLAVVRIVGLPKFNQEYLMRALPNEFIGNIFFLLALMGGAGTIAYQVPIAMHFAVGAVEFLGRVSKLVDERKLLFVRQNRNTIIVTKQKFEVYLFLYSLVGIFLGSSSFLATMLLFQNVAMKSKTNPCMQQAQYQIKVSYANNLSNNGQLPGALRNVFQLIWKGYEKVMNII